MASKIAVVTPQDLGRGFIKNEAKKQIEVDLAEIVDGTSITVENGKLVGKGGLDCEAIGALETVQMDKTVTILGKKGNKCVQVAPLASIFQDVGVGISANKYTGLSGDKFNVKVTVSNTGESTNKKTSLNIALPENTGISAGNFAHVIRGADKITKLSDTSYTIEGIEPGGTAEVSFEVTTSSHGTYQIGASVDPDSALDTNTSNHYASIILRAEAVADPNYIPTVDCPLITATDVKTNTPLLVRSVTQKAAGQGVSYVMGANTTLASTQAHNIMWDRNSLSGVQIKIENAATVIVKAVRTVFTSGVRTQQVGNFLLGNKRTPDYTESGFGLVLDTTGAVYTTSIVSNYTFDPASGLLTFASNADYTNAFIVVRPAGTNCSWQVIALTVPQVLPGCVIDVTPTTGVTYENSYALAPLSTRAPRHATLHIGATGTPENLNAVSLNTKAVITVKKGTERTYTFNSTALTASAGQACINAYNTKGNVEITYNSAGRSTIKISANATPADSVKLPLVEVIITD